MRRLALTLAALLILAVPAFAAPEREAVLTSAAPYTWEGGPGNGAVPSAAGGSPVRCTPVYECEDTLVETRETGDLSVLIKAGGGSTDLDVAIYESDSEGTVNADTPVTALDGTADQPKAEDVSTDADAKATARRLKPGFYLIRVRFYAATQGVYQGTATLAVPPPVVEAPPATPPAPPASAPQTPKKKKASCKAKAKKIKNAKKRKAALKKCRRKKR